MTITPYLIGLIVLLILSMCLVAWAAFTLGDEPDHTRPGRHEKVPQHSRRTARGATRKLPRKHWIEREDDL